MNKYVHSEFERGYQKGIDIITEGKGNMAVVNGLLIAEQKNKSYPYFEGMILAIKHLNEKSNFFGKLMRSLDTSMQLKLLKEDLMCYSVMDEEAELTENLTQFILDISDESHLSAYLRYNQLDIKSKAKINPMLELYLKNKLGLLV